MISIGDEVKFFAAIANFDDLQRDLAHAWDWALACDLPLHENRCGHISICCAPTRPLTLSENGISIKRLHSTTDFGVTFDSRFEPSMHCVQSFKRVRAALFLIR